jgi:hypothetical protein
MIKHEAWWHSYPISEIASLIGPDREFYQKAGLRHA